MEVTHIKKKSIFLILIFAILCTFNITVFADNDIDMDLKTFFDVVNHDRLMYRLSDTIGDKTLLRLIRKYLQCGIMAGGIVSRRTEGTPKVVLYPHYLPISY